MDSSGGQWRSRTTDSVRVSPFLYSFISPLSPSSVSPFPPPPLLLLFLDPAAFRPGPGLPSPDLDHGRPSEPLCLGMAVDGGAPCAPGAGASTPVVGDGVKQ
jgi:hypothetical protein